MLSAETAWRILKAEHARLRELLDDIGDRVARGGWQQPGPALALLRRQARALKDFDDATHRPKGVAILAILRGRSAEADALLDALEADRARCDALFGEVLARLERLERGDARAGDDLPALLQQHRSLTLHHLEYEDRLLHSHTARLLSSEEWSRVVSSISSQVESAGARRPRGRGHAARTHRRSSGSLPEP